MQTTAQSAYDGLDSLPAQVDLVWHGVNDAANLRQFLSADVPWGELDLNTDATGQELILRHDSYAELPKWDGEAPLMFRDVLSRLVHSGKSIKLDFKAGEEWIDDALELVDRSGMSQDRLWLNADLDLFGEDGIRGLATRYPSAIIQIPLHSLNGWMDSTKAVHREIDQIAGWGVNRFSVGWHYPDVAGIIEWFTEYGYEANIFGVRNLQEFVQAIDMGPKSVTADFNFPE